MTKITPADAFSFRDAYIALAGVHDIAENKIPTFMARLKHYQKQGFPGGTNAGRGRAATYRIEHIVKLAVALELNQLGIEPEQAADIITQRDDVVRETVFAAIATSTGSADQRILIVVDPKCLRTLMTTNPYEHSFFAIPPSRLASPFVSPANAFPPLSVPAKLEPLVRGGKVGFRRYSVINMAVIVQELIVHLGGASSRSLEEVGNLVREWADDTSDHAARSATGCG